MFFKIKIIFLSLFVFQFTVSQNVSISGYVKDASNGEMIIGAPVYVKGTNYQTTTNVYGFYSLRLPKGVNEISCVYLSFKSYVKTFNLTKDTTINITMAEEAIEQKEVLVTATAPDQNVKSSQLGVVTLNVEQIKKLPAFMGEVDILKSIQLLPGVKSSGDGQSGFYVRGGGPDQNLILLDEAVVYNASHLMGFFSVFNGDAIKNVTLTKGGMPAQYGGRLSSVLDISMKEGNNQKFQVDGGIGLISSRLTLQGPIKKDTSSFIISARRTYVDAIVKPFFKPGSQFAGTSYYFYDLNTKLNYRINDKNRLYLSGYFGQDRFNFKDASSGFNVKVPWGNATASFRWNHLFSNRLFCNTSAIFSYYDFSFGALQEDFEFKIFSGIRDYNLKTDFTYIPYSKHNFKFGANYVFHTFIPTNVSAKQGETTFDFGKIIKLYCHEVHGYFSDDYDITEKVKLNVGVRGSYFAQVGPFTRYVKNDLGITNDTLNYSKGKKIVDYNGIEPRSSIRFQTSKSSSVKASYTRNVQYIHLASISSVSLPTDVWMPSTQLIKPQIGNQYSVGVFKNFKDNMFETSIEAYYKTMRNLIEYKEGAEPQDNVFDNPDNSFTFGKGVAYGSEFFIRKNKGKFTGWIGYTLSWTKRTFPEINFGQTFYAKYDRRHDVSVVGTYDLNSKWTFSAIWVYGTGNAGTLPNSLFTFEQNVLIQYGLRNSYRFKPYHRMDLSATFTPDRNKHLERRKKRLEKRYAAKGKDISTIQVPHKLFKNHENSWSFSVFNAYNRYNPYFIYFDTSGSLLNGDFKVQAKQVSLFPVLPSVTWNFKF